MILEELRVFDVIKICEIYFELFNFSKIGIMLCNSPTLAP
jgi:hypothetical protein